MISEDEYFLIGSCGADRHGDMLTLFQSEDVATGSSAASAMLLAAITRRMDISKYLRFTT